VERNYCFSYGEASPPPDQFAQISAGTHHACGMLLSGGAKCWGAGSTDIDPLTGYPLAAPHFGQAMPPANFP
jgi:hypothetical protein